MVRSMTGDRMKTDFRDNITACYHASSGGELPNSPESHIIVADVVTAARG